MTALIRVAQAAGGHGTVLAKGDAVAGTLLLVLAERGVVGEIVERAPSLDGGPAWITAGPKDLAQPGAVSDYVARRRRSDPDMWAVEIDVAAARGLVDRVLADG